MLCLFLKVEKIYVQHKMVENGEEIWQILENQGFFYVCGLVYIIIYVCNRVHSNRRSLV